MKRAGSLIGLLMILASVGEAHAQVFLVPGSGYPRRVVFVTGYWPSGYLVPLGTSFYVGPAYGTTTGRVTVYYSVPRPVKLAPKDDELAGVDLDLVKPSRPRPEAVPKPSQPDLPPGKDISVPREPVRPGARELKEPKIEGAAPKPAVPPAAPPRAQDDSGDLVKLGREAFSHGEYGLAAQRFEQAATAAPLAVQPQFLLAEALFTLGKYREAVAAIHAGMLLQPDRPRATFRTRDLYPGNESELEKHLKRLESVVAENPNNANFFFLLGYEYWFDGRRAEAARLFQRARDLGADPAYLDPFLKAAPPGPVAVK